MRKCLGFFVFASLFLCLAGCGNSNMFSWAHDEGSGDYESLMTDADVAMKDNKYAKAANYYAKALNKKPGDADAIYGYSSAAFADAAGASYKGIIEAVISGVGDSSSGLLSFLKVSESEKMQRVLERILSSDMLPAVQQTAGENKVDVNLNAAIAHILLAAVSIINDPDVPAGELNINADFTMDLPYYIAAAQAIKNAVEGYVIPNLRNAETALNNIVAEGGSISSQLMDDLASLKQELNSKGYAIW